MPITVQSIDERLFQLRQELISPVVYLDHWAVRMFADDAALQSRLVAAIHHCGGTLLFSQLNFAEFSAMTDLHQGEAAEALLQAVLPALHLVDFTADPGWTTNSGGEMAGWLLQDLADRAGLNGGVLTTRGLVTDVIRHRESLHPEFDDMKRVIARSIQAHVGTQETRNKARRWKADQDTPPLVAMTSELLRDYVYNEQANFSDNDAVDLMHAADAVTQAKYVLLDASWCGKVERAVERLRTDGYFHEYAVCFSRRDDGLERFLAALEADGPRRMLVDA